VRTGRAWQLGTRQVGRLVRRPDGPPGQMLKEGVERMRGPLAREGVPSYATDRGAGLPTARPGL